MGIWRQRIEGSWLKCNARTITTNGTTVKDGFRIVNLNGGSTMNSFATVVTLKHKSIDYSLSNNTGDYGFTSPSPNGLMYGDIGQNSILGTDVYSYIMDYYFGPSITSTKRFSAKKNYQFKTHVINFAYVENRGPLNDDLHLNSNQAGVIQTLSTLYNSELNCFKGSLGVNPSWEDLHFFDVPFFKDFSTVPMSENTPTTFILYYYSSPNTDVDSGLFSYTNKLKKSSPAGFKNGTQSVYQSTYGISGLEINETNWKIQGYSFVSYDNNPCIGDYTIGLTNSYSGNIIDNDIPNKSPLKYSVFGKGWYYDDVDNEYTWYNRIFNDSRDRNNNPVGGDSGLQETSDGYIENNYIAKYIPFQKFNLSFLYENLRADSGIKIYLSSKLPSSRPLESSKYIGSLYYPINYIRRGPGLTQAWQAGLRYSLVSGVSQIADGGLTLKSGATFSFPNKENIYAPILSNFGIFSNAYSTTIRDYPNAEIVNNILVDDTNTDLKEIKVNLTLRHTHVGDLILNLRTPNGNVINLKSKNSGEAFNDLRNITFTTNIDYPKMKGLNWWPNSTGTGYIWDPIGLNGSPAYTVNAPWLPSPYGGTYSSGGNILDVGYNFNWSQLRIRSGLTFQMDKNNGEGTSTVLHNNIDWSNLIYNVGTTQSMNFKSNVNDLKYLSNSDGTFNGTYSLYIKDDLGGDSGMLESWNIEFLYKKVYTPILSLTQSDPENAINKGAAKLQYLFGLEGNQYLFIVGDKLNNQNDVNGLSYLLASLKNLKIDGGFHDANNKLYAVDDNLYGLNNSITNGPLIVTSSNIATTTPVFSGGVGGNNTFKINDINNISYSTYVGSGDLNNPSTLSLSGVNAKIGNGKFLAGIWENGAWNSGWRYDENLQEFYNIDQFFSYNRDKTWRFSIFGSQDATSKFSIGDKVSIGNIVAINVNEERKVIKSYFTIVTKTIDSISVEFESDFPIRRIKIDSSLHRIYVTKNVWLTGAFLNGYFTGVWNNGLFKGFPYITEMFNSHWIDGTFNGGHFYSRKKSMEFSNTYLATYKTIKVGLIFDQPHRLTEEDAITISSTFSTFGATKVLSVVDDYKVIVDLDWNLSRDPNTYDGAITGTVDTNISTGLVQNLNFSANNVSSVTSLQSMDNTRVFMYDSWMDVNFDSESSVNIGKPQSKIDNTISSYSYSENNLYGYPTYDVLSSDVTFRDSFSGNIRKYKLGSKYKIYQDYIGDAGSFDEHFDITGWATKTKLYPINAQPFTELKNTGTQLPTSQSFLNQGWVINKDAKSTSAISFERTTEALDDEDVVAGKEMKVNSVGKGGVLNIQPAYDVPNRTNTQVDRLRYTIVKFDLLKSLVPDFIFEDSSTIYTDTSKYQPLIHFNNLNYVTRRIYTPGFGYSDKMLDATYLPVYKNINHVETSNTTKVEYFYNKRNLSMSFRGNGLDGQNTSEFIIDNLKLYEVDMIPFFQYFTINNINKSVSIPYEGVAPHVNYVENDYSLIDNSIYGIDSFYIFQPTTGVNIQAESAAAAAEQAQKDPVISNATSYDEYTGGHGGVPTYVGNSGYPSPFDD
jgi:subtilisin-like proprotein convertase family protein